MKNMIRSSVLSLLVIAAPMTFGDVPALKVTVSDAGGNAAFKGTTGSNGGFATANLKPGNYVVQFNSKNAATKGHQYAIVVSAGTKKVVATSVAGEKFAGGGVAMRMKVGPGLNITGQVADQANTVMKNDRPMVWIPTQLGSHLAGHWAEEGSGEAVAARNVGNMRISDIQKAQIYTTGR